MDRKRWIIVCSWFVFMCPFESLCNKEEKTVRLIVPHKIKYIHHTHILVLKPKKKSAHLIDESGDESSHRQHLYRQSEPPRYKTKPRVHYIVPNVAAAKNGRLSEDEGAHFRTIESHRKRRVPSDESSGTRQNDASQSANLLSLSDPYINPKEYETQYVGYDTYSEDDGHIVTNEWNTGSYTLPQEAASNYYDNSWSMDSYAPAQDTSGGKYISSEDQNLWGVTTFTMPERIPTSKKHKSGSHRTHGKTHSDTSSWDSEVFREPEKLPKFKIHKTYYDYDEYY